MDESAFAAACQEALASGDLANKGFVEILLSMAEYKYFVRLLPATSCQTELLPYFHLCEYFWNYDVR
eukprot:SAG31_NODE_181_length_21114_cov_99.705211_4_plen_67_part_00